MLFTIGIITAILGAALTCTFGNRQCNSLADKVGVWLIALGAGLVAGSVTIYLGRILP